MLSFTQWLGKYTQSGRETGPVYVILQKKCLYKKFTKNDLWKLVPGPFNFQRILWQKESEEVYMLIWTNIDSFTITYLI